MTLSSAILYDDTAAGTGVWKATDKDSPNHGLANRSIHGLVVVGDIIELQGTTIDDISNVVASDIVTLNTYTADFELNLNGSWTFLRVVKTGANGLAKVQGRV